MDQQFLLFLTGSPHKSTKLDVVRCTAPCKRDAIEREGGSVPGKQKTLQIRSRNNAAAMKLPVGAVLRRAAQHSIFYQKSETLEPAKV